jgi:hypothetical protein
VQVLEAGQVAAGDDQVHALLVLDVEVADGVAAVVHDAEAQLLGAAATQLRIVDDDAQAVLGDRQAADRMRGLLIGVAAGLALGVGGGGHVVLLVGGAMGALGLGGRAGVRRARLVAIGIDRTAGQRAAAEQDGERRGEAGELGRRAHETTS